MKGLAIINPTSGMQIVQRTVLRVLTTLLHDDSSDGVYLAYTHKKDDAHRITAALRPGEYDYVLAVGGDGTVNEVIAGLYESNCRIPLAILPAGTTNDFATSAGLPHSVQGVVDMIRKRRTVEIDIGRFNNTYFFNVAAGGGLCEVAHNVSIDAKTVFGRLAYLAEGARMLSSFHFRTTPLRFEADGEVLERDVFFFIVANSKSVGGFPNIAPQAKINDGLLDLCIVKKVDPLTVIPALTQIQAGTHIRNQKQFEYRQIRRLCVRTVEDNVHFPLDYDGEFGGNLPLDIEVIPAAIPLIIPGSSNKADKLMA